MIASKINVFVMVGLVGLSVTLSLRINALDAKLDAKEHELSAKALQLSISEQVNARQAIALQTQIDDQTAAMQRLTDRQVRDNQVKKELQRDLAFFKTALAKKDSFAVPYPDAVTRKLHEQY